MCQSSVKPIGDTEPEGSGCLCRQGDWGIRPSTPFTDYRKCRRSYSSYRKKWHAEGLGIGRALWLETYEPCWRWFLGKCVSNYIILVPQSTTQWAGLLLSPGWKWRHLRSLRHLPRVTWWPCLFRAAFLFSFFMAGSVDMMLLLVNWSDSSLAKCGYVSTYNLREY